MSVFLPLQISIINNESLITVQNEEKGGAYVSLWKIPNETITPEQDNPIALHPAYTKALSTTALSSFCTTQAGTELVIGTVNGLVKRIEIESFEEVDWVKETELRVSHMVHIENKNDLILVITSDGSYSIMKLDGQQKEKQMNAMSSSMLFTEEDGDAKMKVRKRRVWIILAIVLGVVIVMIYYIFS